jgi:hypothetical protein
MPRQSNTTTFLLGFIKNEGDTAIFNTKISFENTMIFKTKIFVQTKHLKKRSNFT